MVLVTPPGADWVQVLRRGTFVTPCFANKSSNASRQSTARGMRVFFDSSTSASNLS